MSRCYCSLLRVATRKVGAAYDRVLAPLGINIAQYSMLKMIQRLEPISLTALGESAELDRSTIGRNARVLERMGLVAMRRGDDDQRETVVTLSVRGAQVLDDAAPLWAECQREMEQRLGPAKLIALEEILRSI